MQACTLDIVRRVMDGQLVVVVKHQLHQVIVLQGGMVVVSILMVQVIVPDLVVLTDKLLETVVSEDMVKVLLVVMVDLVVVALVVPVMVRSEFDIDPGDP